MKRIKTLHTNVVIGALFGAVIVPSAMWSAEARATDHRARAIELARVAKARAKSGKFALAAEMFAEAHRVDRSEWSYLYSAARCQQLGGALAEARMLYKMFLKGAPAEHPLRTKAQQQYAALEAEVAALRKTQTQSAPAKQPAGEKQPPPAAKSSGPGPAVGVVAGPKSGGMGRTLGLIAAGLGVAAGGYGGYVLAGAMGRKGDLEAKKQADGTMTGITRDRALADKDAIEIDLTFGGTVAGIGAAVAIAGAVMALSSGSEASTAVVPSVGTAFRGLALHIDF